MTSSRKQGVDWAAYHDMVNRVNKGQANKSTSRTGQQGPVLFTGKSSSKKQPPGALTNAELKNPPGALKKVPKKSPVAKKPAPKKPNGKKK
jgi:hypothetical protein